MLSERRTLPHETPSWVEDSSQYFITICTAPRGQNQLCSPNIAKLIRETLQFRQSRAELWVHLLLLMPDHLHAIMSFSPQVGMQKTLSDWKRYVCLNGGIQWQRDFFDHRLRKAESYIEKANYIRMNPVRAGLVESPADWSYVWETPAR